jgi:multidrug resistance efflux pump
MATSPAAGPASDPNVVSATGVAAPRRWAALSLPTAGRLAEVLVAEGEAAAEGQVLARLEGSESLQAAVASAEYEVFTAQQALDQLDDDLDRQQAEALREVQSAQKAVIDAERLRDQFDDRRYDTDLDNAKSAVVDAEDALKTAQDDFKPYADWDENNETRKSYKQRVDDAQEKLNETRRKVIEIELSKSRLDADLEAAQARLTKTQRDNDMWQNGPDPDAVALAQSQLSDAQAQLSAAQAALADLELRAPFAGVIDELHGRAFEWVIAGQTILVMSEPGSFQIETTDLNEIDAARVAVGDAVSVTFDALPDVTVMGKVARIAAKSSAGSGVNYKAIIELNDIPEGLRWGMTAFVDILVGR